MPDVTLFLIGFLVMVVALAAVWSVGLMDREDPSSDPD